MIRKVNFRSLGASAVRRKWSTRGRERKLLGRTDLRRPSMPHTRINVKTHVPTPRPEWVSRTRLVTELTASRNVRLILVSAPAGFGKSTLIAEWRIAQLESRPFAWVSLDKADNDPISLWSAIVASLDEVVAGLDGERLIRTLRHESPDVETLLLPRLLNALAARQEAVVLVLDDYHVLDEPVCHRQIEAFLDRLPPTVQLVLATRTDPPLALGRYRSLGELAEVRMNELRFTPDETALFTHRIAGVQLRAADLHDLVVRAEGWPAAIYLAALSLRRSSDPASFIHDFAGTNRVIFDYLSQELLRPLPADVRRFLLRTSILGSFTAPLCRSVADAPNAAELLDQLERSNLLLIPLDDNRRWYRYHHLFMDALRGELALAEPDIVPELHDRASTWLDEHGMISEAIDHALVADNADHAADLFTRYWVEYVNEGRLATVRGWIASIGAPRIGDEPVTAICAAWVAGLSGDRQAMRHWLAVAESRPHEGPLPDGSPSVRFMAALMRAIFGFDGVPEMLRAAETAVALGPEPTSRWFALARVGLGYSRYLSGDLDEAIGPLEDAAQSGAALPTFRILALSILSLAIGELGRTAQAAELAKVAYELVEDTGLTRSSTATLASTALGAAYIREGRYELARKALEHSLSVRRRIVGISAWPTLNSIVTLANLSLDLGERTAARALLDEARDLVAAQPASSAHIDAVLAKIERRLSGPLRGQPLAEALTEREVAVLRLLRGSLSLRGIARELHVSGNTVKSHTRAIYRKLGVASRQEAVTRAREMGIL